MRVRLPPRGVPYDGPYPSSHCRFAAATTLRPARKRRVRASTMSSPPSARRSRCYCLRPAVIAGGGAPLRRRLPRRRALCREVQPRAAPCCARLWDGGVRHFDCASPAEVALVRRMLPEAAIHYMHPVKSRAAIREAYARLRRARLRARQLRRAGEAAATETGDGRADLGLIVRLALPKGSAVYDLSGKFGAAAGRRGGAAARRAAASPRGSASASMSARSAWSRSAYAPRHGAGRRGDPARRRRDRHPRCRRRLPGQLPGHRPAAARRLHGRDRGGVRRARPARGARGCGREPGRALVGAAARRWWCRCELRRGDALYVNDGVYGSLSDAGAPAFRFPARLHPRRTPTRRHRTGGSRSTARPATAPTACAGPFVLPADIREGDWIEIGQLGAYGACLRTAFNGFDRARLVEVSDAPAAGNARRRAGTRRSDGPFNWNRSAARASSAPRQPP